MCGCFSHQKALCCHLIVEILIEYDWHFEMCEFVKCVKFFLTRRQPFRNSSSVSVPSLFSSILWTKRSIETAPKIFQKKPVEDILCSLFSSILWFRWTGPQHVVYRLTIHSVRFVFVFVFVYVYRLTIQSHIQCRISPDN